MWVPQTDDFKGVMSSPRDFSGYVTGTNAAVFSPQGGLRISAGELARVMVLHINKGRFDGRTIVSKKSIKLMHKQQWVYNGSNGDVEDSRPGSRGLSVHILPVPEAGDALPPEAHMMGHTGSAYGLVSDFFFEPDGRYGFIFITNGIFDEPRKGKSGTFYTFEEALIKALRENSLLPCR
jgi:CubicO group peptidase (beta-lactamase class C family)